MASERPGRNDPCWCGSGKKYKRCHQDRDEAPGTGAVLEDPPPALRNPLILGAEERESMRRSCRFNAELMDFIRPYVIEGVTTDELDRRVHEYTLAHGHTPACLGYLGYPRSICTSINEVVCHGIPSEDQVLLAGDIVNVDLTTIVDGWYGDQSETFIIGEVEPSVRELVQVTFDSLYLGIRALTPACSINEVGRAIEPHAHAHGFSVVQEYQGHGIGRRFHQEPSVLHYPSRKLEHVRVPPGICFTIEPMINEGTWATRLDRRDGWTVRTGDGKRSCQFEHTILMTEEGPEILTTTRDGPQEGHRF